MYEENYWQAVLAKDSPLMELLCSRLLEGSRVSKHWRSLEQDPE